MEIFITYPKAAQAMFLGGGIGSYKVYGQPPAPCECCGKEVPCGRKMDDLYIPACLTEESMGFIRGCLHFLPL